MLSFLGAALLAALIGAAIGLLATQVPVRRKPGPLSGVALGAVGAVLAGFVLPQVGAPVSKSLSMGMVTSAVGATLPLVAWVVLRSTSDPRAVRLRLFRLAWGIAGALCMINAALVLASMPLAIQMPISEQTVIVSGAVAIALFAGGFLVLRIASQVSAVCRLYPPDATASTFTDSMRQLLGSLILAGVVLDAILGLVAVAFLSRIDEGFAIFG